MFYAIIIAITVAIGIIGFVSGINIGKRLGKYQVVSHLRLFINKVLELVPPEKYDDLKIQVEYLYSQINEE